MIPQVIFSHLLHNEEYARKVLPFLKPEYFGEFVDKTLFQMIDGYSKYYNKLPTKEVLFTQLDSLHTISEDQYKACQTAILGLDADPDTSVEWLKNETEKFCQEKAIFNAISDSIKIIDKKDDKRTTGAIPEILTEALSVSFDTNIGHDYLEDFEDRYDFYHTKEQKLEFDLHFLNKITGGGLSKKTLNVIMASTGVGKTMFMTHCASHHLAMGKNVLYITMEMAQERIAERNDSNLMDVPISDLKQIPKDVFGKKIKIMKEKGYGKLIIKEYPPGSVSAAHFRHLIQELRIKKKFVPDVIYIDYLNICASSRIKMGGSINSYTYVKTIAEEIRGLAIEFDVPIISATQSNRGGYNSSDMGSDDVSESWGLVATVDLFLALISTEELEQMQKIIVKQLKNRYGDMNLHRRFAIGIERSRMRFYDVEQDDDLTGDKAIMSNTKFGERQLEEASRTNRKNFSGLKMEA